MHGVKKGSLTEERKKLIRKNVKLYKELNSFVLSQKRKKIYTEEMLEKCGKVLSINSEHYTVWNYRREILLHLFETKYANNASEQGRLLQTECATIIATLQRNPKSYSGFHHRVWCVTQDSFKSIDLSQELKLCSNFLSLDSRNFHCWDYRRFIVSRMDSKNALKDEFKYSKELIEVNFSNYSAWHYRTTLIPLLCGENMRKLSKRIKKELDFVKNAFYTEPNDQSAWLYHRWLLGRDGYSYMSGGDGSEMEISNVHKYELSIDELKGEYTAIDEFLTVEPLSKWGLLTYCVLIQALNRRGTVIDCAKEKVNEAFKTLVDIDKIRKNYYLEVKDLLITQGSRPIVLSERTCI